MLTVLSQRSKLSTKPNISVKPDKSSEDRKIESLLLLERRKLISSGTDSKSIKLCHNKILVDNVIYGMVRDSSFVPSTNHSETPPPNVTENRNSCMRSQTTPYIKPNPPSSHPNSPCPLLSFNHNPKTIMSRPADYMITVFLLDYGMHEAWSTNYLYFNP